MFKKRNIEIYCAKRKTMYSPDVIRIYNEKNLKGKTILSHFTE